MKQLKKKIKFFKYYSLFSKNKLFFICLLDNSKNYSFLRKQLVLRNFTVKFVKNGFLKNLAWFFNLKDLLTGQLFCVLKDKLEFDDHLILKDLLFENSHVIFFYLDNKFYSSEKLKFITKFFKSKISNLSSLSYFYFLLKLGFILKLEKVNKVQLNRVHMT